MAAGCKGALTCALAASAAGCTGDLAGALAGMAAGCTGALAGALAVSAAGCTDALAGRLVEGATLATAADGLPVVEFACAEAVSVAGGLTAAGGFVSFMEADLLEVAGGCGALTAEGVTGSRTGAADGTGGVGVARWGLALDPTVRAYRSALLAAVLASLSDV